MKSKLAKEGRKRGTWREEDQQKCVKCSGDVFIRCVACKSSSLAQDKLISFRAFSSRRKHFNNFRSLPFDITRMKRCPDILQWHMHFTNLVFTNFHSSLVLVSVY
jgi:hypothetical protein